MAFVGYSLLAIALASVAGFAAGSVYYGILGKRWASAAGIDDPKPSAGPMVTAFVANVVMAVMLAGLLGHLDAFTLRHALISVAFVWLGFVLAPLATNYAFQERPIRLTIMDSIHWLLVLSVQAMVIVSIGI